MKSQNIFLIGLSLGAALFAADGAKVYDASCKKCHGADGTPNAAIAKMMKVEMKALGAKEVLAKSDADLKKIVKEGTGKMKGIALPDADAAAVVAHMRTPKK